MSSLEYTFRPMGAFPKPFTCNREVAKFTSSVTGKRTPLGTTYADLEREIRLLGGRNITIQVALKDADIRLDGQIRSTARQPEHPGVILSFDDSKGPMSFAQDKFTHWHDNLRSIALTLNALRTVDRFGVTQHGEQYQGFRALASKTVEVATKSPRYEAAEVLVRYSRIPANVRNLLSNMQLVQEHYIEAVKLSHPDHGGSSEANIEVREALKILQGDHR